MPFGNRVKAAFMRVSRPVFALPFFHARPRPNCGYAARAPSITWPSTAAGRSTESPVWVGSTESDGAVGFGVEIAR